MVERLEQMLLVAILDNSESLHADAQSYARSQNFTQKQITKACKKVTSFLKFHGVSRLLEKERKAIIKLQAFFRMCNARSRLRKLMLYWENLAKLDSLDHMEEAEKIYKVLNRPKKRRKRSV